MINYGPNILYLLLKSINTDKSIGVSNLKYEIEKSTLDKFGNNVKYLLYDTSSNYSIIIDKGDHHEYYVCHIFRALLSMPKPTLIFSLKEQRIIGTQEKNPQNQNSPKTLLTSTINW